MRAGAGGASSRAGPDARIPSRTVAARVTRDGTGDGDPAARSAPTTTSTSRVDPTLGDPAKVATDWLTTNGYDLTSLDGEVLSPYLRDGLDLLAFKLTTGTNAARSGP